MTGAMVGPAGEDNPGYRPGLRGSHRCDVAIVGAGLTGLSTAIELAESAPHLRIVVVEAEHVAAGASGRGTGLLAPRVGPALSVARARFGDDRARAAYRWSVDAVRHVIALIERHRISCDLVPGSQLVVAADERAAEQQRREADAARMLGLPVALVSRDDLPPVARHYVSGLRYTPAATLDPAALTRQLARIAEQRGVTIHEHSAVRRVRRGLLTTVCTDDGTLVAQDVVLAVNGFGLTADRNVVGVRVQAGVTEKLSAEALAELDGLRTEPVIEHGELSPYFRLTSDDRIVVGGGAIRRDPRGSVALAPGKLRAAVRGLSPLLSTVDIDAAWSGPIGVTRDGLPVLGRHPDDRGLYFAGGCNGHGVAVSIHHGATLARWIATGDKDDQSVSLPWVRPRAPWLPRGRLVDNVLDRYLTHLSAASGVG